MHSPSLPEVLMQITDGHPARAADDARTSACGERFPAAEQLVRLAILRRARERALTARVFGEPAPVRAGGGRRQTPGEGLG